MKRKWLKFVLTGVFVAGLVGSSYAEGIKFDGELRLRGVVVDNSDSGATKKGGFFEQRTRLNASGTVDENTTVFIQAQDSRNWGSESGGDINVDGKIDGNELTTTTGSGVNSLDLSQGYIKMDKLFGQPLSLTLGRQALSYGDQRLIGPLEWSNNARRFDAVKFVYTHDIANVDVFWAKVMDGVTGDFNDDNNLLGVYASLKVVPQNNIDVYLLDKIAGTAKFYTLGGRVKSDSLKPMNVDLGAEIAIQTGDSGVVATPDQNANAYAVTAGYTIPDVMGLRVGAEYDSATGDNGKKKGFDNLYPTNHYLYGFYDDINWTNIKAMSVNASVKPMDNMKVAVEYWSYKKAETTTAAPSDDLGTEINIKANHQKSKNVSCELAYVIRDAGKAGAKFKTLATTLPYGDITKDKSATFAYFMVNVKFN